MIKETYNYFLSLEEPLQGCMLALRSIILSQDENIVETQKWSSLLLLQEENVLFSQCRF